MDIRPFEIIYHGNYMREEADTLLVHVYKKGSNFTEHLASETHRAISASAPYSFLPNPHFEADYIFSLQDSARNDTVTDFTTRLAYCTSCDRYDNGVTILTGFTHNGVRVEGNVLHIRE